MIPKQNMFALATEESITFYNPNTNDAFTLKDDLTFTLNDEKQSGKLRRMDCTSDGSRIILVFGAHLNVYNNFDSNHGLDSSSMSSISLPLQDGKEIGDVSCIAISVYKGDICSSE